MSECRSLVSVSQSLVENGLAAQLSIEELVKKANELHAKILKRERTNLNDAREIGECLNWAKMEVDKQLGARHWKQWIADEFDGSYATANVYRNIAKYWDEVKDCASIEEARQEIQRERKRRTDDEKEGEFDSCLGEEATPEQMKKCWQKPEVSESKKPKKEPPRKTRMDRCIEEVESVWATFMARQLSHSDYGKELIQFLGFEKFDNGFLEDYLNRLVKEVGPVATVVVNAYARLESGLAALKARTDLTQEERRIEDKRLRKQYEQEVQDGCKIDELPEDIADAVWNSIDPEW